MLWIIYSVHWFIKSVKVLAHEVSRHILSVGLLTLSRDAHFNRPCYDAVFGCETSLSGSGPMNIDKAGWPHILHSCSFVHVSPPFSKTHSIFLTGTCEMQIEVCELRLTATEPMRGSRSCQSHECFCPDALHNTTSSSSSELAGPVPLSSWVRFKPAELAWSKSCHWLVLQSVQDGLLINVLIKVQKKWQQTARKLMFKSFFLSVFL